MPAHCQRCLSDAPTSLVTFNSNVSILVRRYEKRFCGRVCAKCAWLLFAKFEGTTLVGTWWGIVGVFRGGYFLFKNIAELDTTLSTIRKQRRM